MPRDIFQRNEVYIPSEGFADISANSIAVRSRVVSYHVAALVPHWAWAASRAGISPAVHGHKVSESSCLQGTELITAMHPKRGESTLDDFD